MTKEGSAQIVYFMTPGVRVLALGCGHTCICHIVKMHYSFKNLLPFPGIDQKNYVYSNYD